MNPQLRNAPLDRNIEKIASQIIDSAFRVHINLGPGLLEKVCFVTYAGNKILPRRH